MGLVLLPARTAGVRKGLERVCDLYAAALERNRDEFEAGGSQLAPGCKQETARRNRPISLQPFGTAALRAVCGVANPRNSTAIAAVLRLASHPAKPLSRREEIVNTFLRTGARATPASKVDRCPAMAVLARGTKALQNGMLSSLVGWHSVLFLLAWRRKHAHGGEGMRVSLQCVA
ncbi:hypothetical protein GCM10010975_09140 [Comamonas phosphati]|nr:hypothetical protein GCM10010975_09140 [Comamonas phosphati]